jgi:hypothetical protein
MPPPTGIVDQLKEQLNGSVERVDHSENELRVLAAPWDKNKNELDRLTTSWFNEWKKQLNAIDNDRKPLDRLFTQIGLAYYFIGSIPSHPSVQMARRHNQYLRYRLAWLRFLSLLLRLVLIVLGTLLVLVVAGLLYLFFSYIYPLIDTWVRSFLQTLRP